MWYFFLEAFFLPVFLLIWSGSGVEKSLGTANINTRRNKLNQHLQVLKLYSKPEEA